MTAEPTSDTLIDADTLVGVTGAACRALVSPCGDVIPLRGLADDVALQWYIAAEDRWHVPAGEPAIRQHRIEGAPVTETRLKVPEGDAVQRVWSVPDAGGLTVIEVENQSALPFAVAFTGPRVLTERPPADVPIEGIELPGDAIVLPSLTAPRSVWRSRTIPLASRPGRCRRCRRRWRSSAAGRWWPTVPAGWCCPMLGSAKP